LLATDGLEATRVEMNLEIVKRVSRSEARLQSRHSSAARR